MTLSYRRLLWLALLTFIVFVAGARAQEPPPGLNVYWGEIPRGDRVFYIDPHGDNANPGTLAQPWATLDYATNQAQPGDVFVLRGGVYYHNTTIKISRHGTAEKPITIAAYPGETPVLDFSGQAEEGSQNGLRLNGWYWHVIGITVRYAGHNGIRVDGSHNILDQVTAYGNRDTGIHMAGNASYNLIKNCDSFWNFDRITAGENADGFGAKFDILPGNHYYGCRAWENSDDGFDFWRAASTITVENCWAFNNGDPSLFGSPANFGGDGNGFKLGGDYVPGDHVVVRCLAFDNLGPARQSKGFDHNNNTGALTLLHNTAYNNGRNFYFPRDPIRSQSLFVNNLSVTSPVLATVPPTAVVAGNSWQIGVSLNEDVFLSVDTQLAKSARQRDGSLPEVGLLKPKPSSPVVDRGVLSGQPYCGSAPDIGAYEVEMGEWHEPFVERGSGARIKELLVYDVENAQGWGVRADFAQGIDPYGDGTTTVLSIPGGVHVWEWIQTSPGSRTKNYLFTLAEFVSEEACELFVAHSARIAAKPEWLQEYESTGLTMTLVGAGGSQEVLALFRRVTEPGERVMLGRNSKDGTTAAAMYLVLVGSTSQGVANADFVAPAAFDLVEAYPNPFCGSTTIRYEVAAAGYVALQVFDLSGRRVAELAKGPHQPGTYAVTWQPDALPVGVYFCRLRTGKGLGVQRLLMLR